MKKTLILTIFLGFALLSKAQEKTLKVAVFIYQGVELLDFAGPLEVFSNTKGFEVFTVAPVKETILAMNKNIQFIPNYGIDDAPKADIIVFPGANMEGLMPVYNNAKVIDWIKESHKSTMITMSVCTGAAFLSKAGILDEHTVTTHWAATKNLQTITPKAKVVSDKRFVEDGKLLTTAGVSAGLDGALYIVSKLRGMEEAIKVAKAIEYDKWQPEAGLIVKQEEVAPKKKSIFEQWVALDEYHKVMSATFHPAENGDLKPLYQNAADLATKAKTLKLSAIPADYQKEGVANSIALLEKESIALAKLVAKKKSEEELKKDIFALHDRFHEIMGKCMH